MRIVVFVFLDIQCLAFGLQLDCDIYINCHIAGLIFIVLDIATRIWSYIFFKLSGLVHERKCSNTICFCNTLVIRTKRRCSMHDTRTIRSSDMITSQYQVSIRASK